MLDGIPIVYEIKEDNLTEFLNQLDQLRLKHAVLTRDVIPKVT